MPIRRRSSWPLDRQTMAVMALCVLLPSAAAVAQTAAAIAATEAAPSERAQRDADKVFHWIMIQGDRTRKGGKDGAAKDTPPVKDAKDDKPVAASRPIRAVRLQPEGAAALAGAGAAPAPTAAPSTASALSASPSTTPAVAMPAARPAAATAGPALAANDLKAASSAVAPVIDVGVTQPRAELEESAASMPATAGDAEADGPLVPLAQTAPQFPLNVMRTLRRGSVQVRFTVRPDGSVAEPQVLASTSARLNAAALSAIGQWRFQPIARAQTGAVELGFDLD